MRVKNRFIFSCLWVLDIVLSLTLLLSCSGSEQTVGGPGGGIDGTGFTAGSGNGDITGFGSVIFGSSVFEVDPDSTITIDGSEVLESDLRIGMVANYLIADDATASLATGTAQLIEVSSLARGPVTSINPLRVLGIPVIIDNDTQCEAISCTGVSPLNVGDIVTVYGFQGDDSIIRATRLELKTALAGNLPIQWKLSGWVDAVGSGDITVSGQLVNTGGAMVEDCASGITTGDYVTVLADSNPVGGFSTLNLVQSVRCGQQGIQLPDEVEQNDILGKAEGIVSGYSGMGDTLFKVGGQAVNIDPMSASLEFENGTLQDLINGTRVEVEGSFDTVSQVLDAEEIEFESERIEIRAPVDPVTINTMDSNFEVMGITVQIDLATSDEVGILSGGLIANRQLAIKARHDAGDIIAEEIRDEGEPKPEEVKIQGLIENISVGVRFEILGLGVTLNPTTQFSDSDDNTLPGGATEFFSLVSEGDIVEVQGEFSIGPPAQIDADEVEIE